MPYVEYDEAQALCSECGRAFPSEESLEDHRRGTHGSPDHVEPGPAAPRVSCSVCPATFRTTAALLEHSRRAHTN